jgi:hypothetical protein
MVAFRFARQGAAQAALLDTIDRPEWMTRNLMPEMDFVIARRKDRKLLLVGNTDVVACMDPITLHSQH